MSSFIFWNWLVVPGILGSIKSTVNCLDCPSATSQGGLSVACRINLWRYFGRILVCVGARTLSFLYRHDFLSGDRSTISHDESKSLLKVFQRKKMDISSYKKGQSIKKKSKGPMRSEQASTILALYHAIVWQIQIIRLPH